MPKFMSRPFMARTMVEAGFPVKTGRNFGPAAA
jgi:hypothetical protein